MTNADKIRVMSDEELASILDCPNKTTYPECVVKSCKECLLEWLQSEAE